MNNKENNLKKRIQNSEFVEQQENEKRIFEKLSKLDFSKENKVAKTTKNLYLAKDTLNILEKYGIDSGWGVSKIISLILRDWIESDGDK